MLTHEPPRGVSRETSCATTSAAGFVVHVVGLNAALDVLLPKVPATLSFVPSVLLRTTRCSESERRMNSIRSRRAKPANTRSVMKMTRQNAARLNPMNPDSVVVLERSCFSDSRVVMLRE